MFRNNGPLFLFPSLENPASCHEKVMLFSTRYQRPLLSVRLMRVTTASHWGFSFAG